MIVPRRLLLGVLGILMFFTLATVGAAQLEVLIAHQFDVVIPQWINVAVALSIATIKTVFVMAIFMQLRWDNPFNSLIMVFTVFTLSLFLGFIMLDLGNRQSIYSYKGEAIIEGGSGNISLGTSADGRALVVPANSSIGELARTRALEDLDRQLLKDKTPLPKYLVVFAAQEIDRREAAKQGGDKLPPALKEFNRVRTDPRYAAVLDKSGHHDGALSPGSSADRSRISTGITDPEFGAKGPHGAGSHGAGSHGAGNSDHAPGDAPSDSAEKAKPAAPAAPAQPGIPAQPGTPAQPAPK